MTATDDPRRRHAVDRLHMERLGGMARWELSPAPRPPKSHPVDEDPVSVHRKAETLLAELQMETTDSQVDIARRRRVVAEDYAGYDEDNAVPARRDMPAGLE